MQSSRRQERRGTEWHPKVRLEECTNELSLKKDGTLANTITGASVPDADELFSLLEMTTMRNYDNYTIREMLQGVSF